MNQCYFLLFINVINKITVRGHPFSTYAKFSGKLTFLNPIRTRTCAYQGVRNVSFPENFAYVLN